MLPLLGLEMKEQKWPTKIWELARSVSTEQTLRPPRCHYSADLRKTTPDRYLSSDRSSKRKHGTTKGVTVEPMLEMLRSGGGWNLLWMQQMKGNWLQLKIGRIFLLLSYQRITSSQHLKWADPNRKPAIREAWGTACIVACTVPAPVSQNRM